VTFRSHGRCYDLPDPRYLKLHAACCRVAHMSGAAGYLDDDFTDDWDEEETKVLAEDGSGAKFLKYALLASGGTPVMVF
jgi:hypothetical protein